MDEGPTEIRTLAERVVFGPSLADKLWAGGPLVDDAPGAPLAAPKTPGRDPGLQLVTEPARGGVPSDAELADPHARVRLLHAFANHELQAIELMGLALLRFVDAPPPFRRGLSAALREEQDHLRAYLQRMKALGGHFGEHALSGFFWRVMAPMPDARDFVAHMSLTFEQANLDFAQHYAACLHSVGDHETAAILERVRDEEIGHVKLGLVWFRRWSDTGPSLFEAHTRALRAPITARRARGIGFDREARARAGLPADYVEQLEAFEASRGRAPVVHVFDPTAELDLAHGGSYTPDNATRAMTRDLAMVPAFAAASDDIVLVARRPSLQHLRSLRDAGLPTPQLVEVDPEALQIPVAAVAPHARLGGVAAWGWSATVRRRYGSLLARVEGSSPPPASTDAARASKATWVDLRAELHRELAAEGWLDEPDTLGATATDLETVIAHARRFAAHGYRVAVVKAIFGTAGRAAQRIEDAAPDDSRRRWIERTLSAQGSVVVEPWLDRVCDVSLRIGVARDGTARIDDHGRFLADRRGQYAGAVLGPLTRAVPPPIARFLHGEGRDPRRLARVSSVVAARVGAALHALGHTGPAGIDGLIYRDRDGRFRLRPLVEVNARPNFGHVAAALGRHVARKSAAVWLIVPLRELPGDLDGWIAELGEGLPLLHQGTPRQIVQGVVPTTDPTQAEQFGSVLLVARTKAEIDRRLAQTAPKLAARIGSIFG